METPLRHVFFVHGFERRGARYHNLWQRREAKAYSVRHGVDLSVTPILSQTDDMAVWEIATPEWRTRFHFLDWSGLVAERFAMPWWKVALTSLPLGIETVWRGIFGKVRRSDWGLGAMLVWGFAPLFLALLLPLLVALFAPLAGAIMFLVAMAGLWALHRWDRQIGSVYILHIAWAARHLALRDTPAFDARIAAFREVLTKAAITETGEWLIVGHSLGAALALELATLVPAQKRAETSLLTVGQSIPIIALQPDALATQAALDTIDIPWIDVFAGRDLLGFKGFDPSGGRARTYSARFTSAFDPEAIRAMRWQGIAMHFQYFQSNRTRGLPWDWFDILTGQATISERFQGENAGDGLGGRRFPI